MKLLVTAASLISGISGLQVASMHFSDIREGGARLALLEKLTYCVEEIPRVSELTEGSPQHVKVLEKLKRDCRLALNSAQPHRDESDFGHLTWSLSRMLK
jgi:hypothetical protein